MINDIRLKQTSPDTWDWSFLPDGAENVTGLNRLVSAVIHTVMLRSNELDLPFYTGKGCSAHDIFKNNSVKSEKYIKESIEVSLRQVKGIVDATVELKNNGSLLDAEITIRTTNGNEVTISAT